MFLLPWLPCLSMMRTLIDKVDVRVKVTEGERGGEKKTCFFSFLSQSHFPTPFWWTFADPKKMHVMQAPSIYFTTWHKLNNVSGCINIQH